MAQHDCTVQHCLQAWGGQALSTNHILWCHRSVSCFKIQHSFWVSHTKAQYSMYLNNALTIITVSFSAMLAAQAFMLTMLAMSLWTELPLKNNLQSILKTLSTVKNQIASTIDLAACTVKEDTRKICVGKQRLITIGHLGSILLQDVQHCPFLVGLIAWDKARPCINIWWASKLFFPMLKLG